MWWRGGGSCGDGPGVIVNTLGCKASTTRSALKTSLFPVERPGDNICADWELFFSFSIFDFIPPPPAKKKKKSVYLLKKKKKKKKKRGKEINTLRSPDIFWPPAVQKTTFCKGGPGNVLERG